MLSPVFSNISDLVAAGFGVDVVRYDATPLLLLFPFVLLLCSANDVVDVEDVAESHVLSLSIDITPPPFSSTDSTSNNGMFLSTPNFPKKLFFKNTSLNLDTTTNLFVHLGVFPSSASIAASHHFAHATSSFGSFPSFLNSSYTTSFHPSRTSQRHNFVQQITLSLLVLSLPSLSSFLLFSLPPSLLLSSFATFNFEFSFHSLLGPAHVALFLSSSPPRPPPPPFSSYLLLRLLSPHYFWMIEE